MSTRWEDTTSHSRNESAEERLVQRESTLDTGRIRIVVHRHRNYDPGEWMVTTYPTLEIRSIVARDCPIEVAQANAIDAVRSSLTLTLRSLEDA